MICDKDVSLLHLTSFSYIHRKFLKLVIVNRYSIVSRFRDHLVSYLQDFLCLDAKHLTVEIISIFTVSLDVLGNEEKTKLHYKIMEFAENLLTEWEEERINCYPDSLSALKYLIWIIVSGLASNQVILN
jgi:hypothetical protein